MNADGRKDASADARATQATATRGFGRDASSTLRVLRLRPRGRLGVGPHGPPCRGGAFAPPVPPLAQGYAPVDVLTAAVLLEIETRGALLDELYRGDATLFHAPGNGVFAHRKPRLLS